MHVHATQSFNLIRLLAVLLLTTTLFSCQKELHGDAEEEIDHNLIINFKAVVQYDSAELELGTAYKNYFNESFTVEKFRFYIHDIALINSDSNKVYRLKTDQYFLVDFADSVSTQIKIGVLPYTYNKISFTLGVDSTHNVSGAQAGALDPAKGMFWTWNTGYIMAMLEGTSPVSTASGKFAYHIGGFKKGEDVNQFLTLLFPFGKKVDVQSGKIVNINITADAYDWFNSPHDIKIRTNPTVMEPGGVLAQQVAENYSKMFTVAEINNE